jgi:predicted RNase H-like HicB family nuclease
MQYAIIIEQSDSGFGAYVPDLPGCVAAGQSEDEVRELIREAIEFHLDGLREEGQPLPAPSARVEYIDVQSAA